MSSASPLIAPSNAGIATIISPTGSHFSLADFTMFPDVQIQYPVESFKEPAIPGHTSSFTRLLWKVSNSGIQPQDWVELTWGPDVKSSSQLEAVPEVSEAPALILDEEDNASLASSSGLGSPAVMEASTLPALTSPEPVSAPAAFDDSPKTAAEISALVSAMNVPDESAWSKAANEALIYEVIWMVRNFAEHPGGQIWNVLANRLTSHGISKSWSAVKNQWNRKLRSASGVDERRVKNPERLQTSLLSGQKKKKGGKDAESGVKKSVVRKGVVKGEKRKRKEEEGGTGANEIRKVAKRANQMRGRGVTLEQDAAPSSILVGRKTDEQLAREVHSQMNGPPKRHS